MLCRRYALPSVLLSILVCGGARGQVLSLLKSKLFPGNPATAVQAFPEGGHSQEPAVHSLPAYSTKSENVIANETTIKPQVRNSGNSTYYGSGGKKEIHDCLGLGSSIARQLESLLKKDDNGTRAQDARFYMSSRRRPRYVQVITGNQFGLEWTDFQIHRKTVVIIHGFLSNGNETWMHSMADAFLHLEDVNIIIVDWSDGGNTYNYYKAVVNARTTGNQVATLFGQIGNYTLEHGGPRKEAWGGIHCVGHSLGAHICGYAAHEIKRRGSRWQFRRITGLDPAQPCFQTLDLSLKLDKTDAPFVDVIHTNGRFLTDLGLGLPEPIGHIDFFPNGGKRQPGCFFSSFKIPFLSIPSQVINKAICSHGRSYLYFTESIINAVDSNCTFWAHPWDRSYRNLDQIFATECHSKVCSEMGIRSDKYHFRGAFFTLTSASQPYCLIEDSDKEEVRKILKEDYKESLED